MTATSLLALVLPQSTSAAQTIPYKINFGGRLTDQNGNILANGQYNIKFRIYDAATSGTNLWEEDRVFAAADNRITVTNGLFNVQFGDLTVLSPSLFNTSALRYVEMELPTPASATCASNGCAVFTEGPFSPRQIMGAAPYAFNSDTLDGLDSSAFAQLSAANTFADTATFSKSGGAGIILSGTPASAGSFLQIGSVLSSGNANGTLIGANGAFTGDLINLQVSNVTKLKVDNSGNLTLASGANITIGANAGSNTTCSGGQFLQNQIVTGGVVTGGSCAAATTDLQTVYGTSSSPATMSLNTSAKDLVFNATDQATDPNILFNLQCTTCSANGGRFAVQDGGTDVFTVNPNGSIAAAPAASQNFTINLPASSGVRVSSTTAPTVDQFNIDNTASTGVATAGVNGVSVNYKGGAAAVEAAGMRVDYAPGTTSGGTWSGLRIVAGATGSVSGVTSYGIKLEGPTSPGTGTEEGMYVGTGWDIGLDVQSGGLQLAAQADPATPAAGNLRVYAKDIAGRILPKWVGPAGIDTPFQANLGFNRVSWCTPSGGATLTTFISCMGSSFTNTGTANNPTPASTNLFTSTRRATFSTGTIAGTVSSHRQGVLQVWRGNAAGLGGFFYTIRFGTDTLASGNRAFVGMADSISLPTNVDPTTTTAPGKIGLAINANTGNWKLVNNVTGTAPTVLDLGATFPVNTTSLYELILFSAQNGSSVGYRVTNLSTGAQTSGSLSTNIPTNTTFLAPQFWITNNATAAAAILDFGGWYLESDN